MLACIAATITSVLAKLYNEEVEDRLKYKEIFLSLEITSEHQIVTETIAIVVSY